MNRKTSILVAALAAVLLGVAIAWLLVRGAGVEHHGAPFDPAVPSASLADIVAKPESALSGDLRISGKIMRQCPSRGCWFYLRSDSGAELKVEMGDYTPDLPMRIGDIATVEGRLIRYGDKYMFIGKSVDFQKP